MRAIVIILLTVIVSGISYAKCVVPAWSSGSTVKRVGKIVTVTCRGEGATDELSEMEAREKCDGRAALEFKSTVKVKEIVITTDHDTALHSETEDNACIIGLVCEEPQAQTCKEGGSYTTWRRCRYDFAQAHEGSAKECGKDQDTGGLESEAESVRGRKKIAGAGTQEKGAAYIMSLTVSPKCDDLMVVGSKGRRVNCKRNPVTVTVYPSDREVIIRKKGFLPKTVPVGASVNVYLDTAD